MNMFFFPTTLSKACVSSVSVLMFSFVEVDGLEDRRINSPAEGGLEEKP